MGNELEQVLGGAGCVGSIHAIRLSDGAEVGHEPDRPQVMASVVKVPIGLEFYDQAQAGALDPSMTTRVSPGRRTPGPTGISQFVDPVVVSLRDLA